MVKIKVTPNVKTSKDFIIHVISYGLSSNITRNTKPKGS